MELAQRFKLLEHCFYTLYTVYTSQTVLHFLNISIYAFIYILWEV